MNLLPNRLSRRAKGLVALSMVLLFPLAVTLSGCDSQLEEEPFSQITPDTFFQNEDEFVAAAAAVYAQLRNLIFPPMDIQEHSSDEIMVPTRGPDWADGGQWRTLTQHTWTAEHPLVNDAWGVLQTGTARANGVLSSLAPATSIPEAQKAQFAAEVRFLRVYYYYWLMDLYGGVPIVVDDASPYLEDGGPLDFVDNAQPVNPNDPPPRDSRAQVFDFLLYELTGCTAGNFQSSCINSPSSESILATLPGQGDVPYGRATKGAGYGMLARLLVNAEIYSGTPTTNGIDPGTAMYQFAGEAADVVINGTNGVGSYQLANDYFLNFAADNYSSPEILFAATYKAEADVGFQKQQAFLHYNQPTVAGPWNGFTSIAEFYRSFEFEEGPDGEDGTQDDVHLDRRGKMFMAGKQYAAPSSGCFGDECFSDESSSAVKVRPGGDDARQLDFTLEIPNIILEADPSSPDNFALEAPGVRPLKFELDPGATSAANMGNDLPLIRLAEMYLIKAEAETKVNGANATALDALNMVRTRSNGTAADGSTADIGISLSDIGSDAEMLAYVHRERGNEFMFEGLRRSDMVRFQFAHGTPSAPDVYAPGFTNGNWIFQEGNSGHRAVFPIPANRISANPNLEQNPGY